MAESLSGSNDSLHSAAERGDQEAVRSLLKQRCDLDALDVKGWTALHYACFNGFLSIAKLLLENGASLHPAVIGLGKTALYLAASRGHKDIVELLLRNGADVHAVDKYGYTALLRAAGTTSENTLKQLLSYGADIHHAAGAYGETALHIAATKGHETILEMLLRNGVDVHAVNKLGFTALLHAATETFSENTLKQLLSYGADISAVTTDGETVLSLACWFGRSHDAANFLIGCGADVHWGGTNVFSKGWTLVHYAAQKGVIETIQLLLDMKVDVNAETERGLTALHVACAWKEVNAVECLLQNGAHVSHSCRNGFTPLHFVVHGYHYETTKSKTILELLFKYGADVNAEDEEGRTPLELEFVPESSTENVKVFTKQLMNMKAQGLFVSENNMKAIAEDEDAKSFSASCEEEIERMRTSAIGDSSVKIYDIFTKGANRLADFVSNENVERVLESGNYQAEFPIYAGAIFEKFLQGRERRDLLRQSSDWLWAVISEFYELPYVCVQRINRYLMNTDLALQISQELYQQESVSALL